MTTTETAPAPPAPAAPAPNAAARSDRSVPVTFGGILAVVGTVLTIGGGGVLALTGIDGAVDTSRHAYSTPTAALVSGTAKIEDTADVTNAIGHPRIRVSSRAAGSRDVFVGVGPRRDVDRYLAGAPLETVTDVDLDPYKLSKTRRSGDARPKPPARQSFWVAKSSGRTASVDWKVRNGSYRVVVMNADGSRRVETASKLGVKLPHLGTIALVALFAGLAALLAGVGMIAPSVLRTGRDA